MPHVPPPQFAGLVWQKIARGRVYHAQPTEAFLDAVTYAPTNLFRVGIRYDREQNLAVYTSKFGKPGVEEMLERAVAFGKGAYEDRQRAFQERAERARIAEEKIAQIRAEQTAELEARIPVVVAEARELDETWGEFVDGKEGLRKILARHAAGEALKLRDLNVLMTSIHRTSQKIESLWQEARTENREGVDWPDDEVEAGIRKLTEADRDRASKRNRIGWNSQHSARGHWCYAMLAIDRAAALKVARWMLGTYENTQLKRRSS